MEEVHQEKLGRKKKKDNILEDSWKLCRIKEEYLVSNHM